jgi:hypothetical protein
LLRRGLSSHPEYVPPHPAPVRGASRSSSRCGAGCGGRYDVGPGSLRITGESRGSAR